MTTPTTTVPTEPTEAMRLAGADIFLEAVRTDNHASIGKRIWAAMIAAAPVPSPHGNAWRTDFENLPKSGTRALFYRPLAERSSDEVVAVKRVISSSRELCWDSTVPEGAEPFNPTDGMCHVTHWMPLPVAPSEGVEP